MVEKIRSRPFGKNEFVSSSKWSREFVLRLLFVYGPHINDDKQVDQPTWGQLVVDADNKRVRVEDIRKIEWGILSKTLQWWWRKLHEGSAKTQSKNRELHTKMMVEATTYWRCGLSL